MMNQNRFFSYLNVGLPEDILRLKMSGSFERAVRLIDARLENEPFGAFGQLLASRAGDHAALARGISLYKEQALALVQKEIPDFTEQEWGALMEAGRIDWIFLEGQERFLSSFLLL